MTSPAPATCPRCQSAVIPGVNFCGNCGALISGVWGSRTEMFGSTVSVQVTESADSLAQLLTSATIGEYDIYGELGRGGMAAVYLALDLALNRKVAIKTMLPELVVKTDMVQRFKREAQTAAGLNHPHIIQIHTVKETPELVYFVMKYIEGRSLESVVMEQGLLSNTAAQLVLSQVSSALAYAHRKGVVHRDVKPANVMIDEDGWSIVTDFGIAKVQVAQNLTATGTAIGTPAYMSPEQFHNKSITGKSDQYSLGVVAYELLTGKKPFDGATYAEIITQHLFEPVPDIQKVRPEIPANIAVAITRMLAKNPDERFPDLDAAAAAIGRPPESEMEKLRGEMISLAKGARRTVRMSVPVSPIPMTKKAEATVAAAAAAKSRGATVPERAAPTVVEKRSPKPARPRPILEPTPRNIRLWGAVAGVVVVIGGFGAWKVMSSPETVTQPAAGVVDQSAQNVAPSGTPADPSTQTPGSETTPAAATKTPSSAPNTPAPALARVRVTDAPSNAVITLDGQRQSTRTFTARPGTRELRISASGFETMTRRFEVAAGEQHVIAFDRRQVAAAPVAKTQTTNPVSVTQQGLATLQISVQPPANLSVDGESRGEVSRTRAELVPGTHTVRAERTGYVTKDTVVTILAGQTVTIRLQLIARP